MKMLLGLLLMGGALSFSDQASPDSPIRVDHPDPKFRVTLPEGYKPAAKVPPNIVYAYQRLLNKDVNLAITIEILEGRIDPGGVDLGQVKSAALKNLPPGAQFNLSKERWGPYEIDVFESSLAMNGLEFFTAAVQIPVIPRAVQISIAGQKSSEVEIRKDLKQILQTFKGTTHWLTPTQRLLAAVSGGSSVVAWIGLLLYGLLFVIFYRRGTLRGWRFRVGYLSVVVVLFGVALTVGPFYNMTKGKETMDLSLYVLSGTALVVAVSTGRLYQKGRAEQKPTGMEAIR